MLFRSKCSLCNLDKRFGWIDVSLCKDTITFCSGGCKSNWVSIHRSSNGLTVCSSYFCVERSDPVAWNKHLVWADPSRVQVANLFCSVLLRSITFNSICSRGWLSFGYKQREHASSISTCNYSSFLQKEKDRELIC